MYYSEWESYAWTARLKTARQKRRLLKKDRDKKLIKVQNEINQIWQRKKELGYTEIHPPIQKGWKRFFVLRYDVAISKDCEFFEAILARINNEQFSHRKDFKKKRKRKGRKVHEVRPQYLAKLEDWHLYKKPLTEKQKKYFREEWYQVDKSGRMARKWVFTEPWRFVLKIEPNLLTHVRVIDPDLEMQQDKLEQWLERNGLRPRLNKILYGCDRYRDRWYPLPKEKYRQVLRKTALQEYEEGLRGE